jgi:glutathione S-transferase
MKLMYAPASPFARKVRAASIELGLDGEIELVFTKVFPGGENAAYAADYNPLRKIPALAVDQSTVIHDSTVICTYLDARAGGGRIIPSDDTQRWHVLTRHALAQGMCEAAILIRYETWLRPEDLRWPMWIDDQWDKVLTGLDWFEARPATLSGPVDLAHLGLGCLLGYLDFRFSNVDWRGRCPGLDRWFAVLSQRESFTATEHEPPAGA